MSTTARRYYVWCDQHKYIGHPYATRDLPALHAHAHDVEFHKSVITAKVMRGPKR